MQFEASNPRERFSCQTPELLPDDWPSAGIAARSNSEAGGKRGGCGESVRPTVLLAQLQLGRRCRERPGQGLSTQSGPWGTNSPRGVRSGRRRYGRGLPGGGGARPSRLLSASRRPPPPPRARSLRDPARRRPRPPVPRSASLPAGRPASSRPLALPPRRSPPPPSSAAPHGQRLRRRGRTPWVALKVPHARGDRRGGGGGGGRRRSGWRGHTAVGGVRAAAPRPQSSVPSHRRDSAAGRPTDGSRTRPLRGDEREPPEERRQRSWRRKQWKEAHHYQLISFWNAAAWAYSALVMNYGRCCGYLCIYLSILSVNDELLEAFSSESLEIGS